MLYVFEETTRAKSMQIYRPTIYVSYVLTLISMYQWRDVQY